ncbi:MAG: alanine/glycine:cation symporter family protein, partial [Endozoicomonas sp.]
ISSFQALCTSLAAHVGTGNLAGVAIAIYTGGPGAVFWMWLVAMLGMASSFVENTLAQLYKTNNRDGTFRGGPSYYIEKALGLRWLGLLFSSLLLVTFGFIFNAVHSNSVSQAVSGHIDFSPELIGVVITGITGLIVFRGVHSIVRFAELVVPFMALSYLFIAILVVILQFDKVPDVIRLVFESAFGLQSAAGGAVGYSIAQAMMQGIKRGLFSNEAGMGSGPHAAAAATPWPHHPATQGIISMISVFIDTIVICTATAAIILLSGQLEAGSTLNGIQLTQASLGNIVGTWGQWFISISVIFFGFTSVIANYYYGESSLRFIHDHPWALFGYRAAVVILVYIGSISSLETVWIMADLSMGLMALINLLIIVLLSGPAMQVLKDYDRQLKSGKLPVFNKTLFPFLNETIDQDVWVNTCDQSKLNGKDDDYTGSLPGAERL